MVAGWRSGDRFGVLRVRGAGACGIQAGDGASGEGFLQQRPKRISVDVRRRAHGDRSAAGADGLHGVDLRGWRDVGEMGPGGVGSAGTTRKGGVVARYFVGVMRDMTS